MDNVVTILPRSKLRIIDCARAAVAAGQQLYSNGKVLVSAPRKPGADWFRVGVQIKRFRRIAA